MLTETSSSVVLDVKEGMVLIEGDGGLVVGIADGCGSCTNDLNASLKGIEETAIVSTVGGVVGRIECLLLFVRLEIELTSDTRAGGMGSKGRVIS